MTANPSGKTPTSDIRLPPPETTGGKPLMDALRTRQSRRQLSARTLPEKVLSNLLWAANGVNRRETGQRTAPSAVNWQEIDTYVVLPEGVYLYDAAGHTLQWVMGGDLRKFTGVQEFMWKAPLVLVFVADLSKMKGADDVGLRLFSATDAAFAVENVYLFCASEGLSTVAIASVDKPALHKKLNLRPKQEIILTQPVGYPA